MNDIILKGTIRNIEYSHTINDIEYDKADLIVTRKDGQDDIISLRFKKFNNPYKDGDLIELVGNVRSYSKKLEDNKNKVDIYVFTYFDIPYETDDGFEIINDCEIDGRICKIDSLRTTKSGKQNVHFILANNIISSDGKTKINNYIPCTIWGKEAVDFSKHKVSDKVAIHGQLHSHTYKKKLNKTDLEIKTAHEVVVLEYLDDENI